MGKLCRMGGGGEDGYNPTEIKEKSQNETTEKKREKNKKNRKRKKKDVPEMEVKRIKTEGN